MEEFGNYFIEPVNKIGSGTFGYVEKVNVYNKSRTHKTIFARKYFRPSYKPSESGLNELQERFKREVTYQAKCFHNNIVPIYMCNLNSATPWFVMEIAESNLDEILYNNDCVEGERKLSERYKLDVLHMVLNGVAYLHQNGFLHRDIKSLNILKYPDGTYKISDFGLVKNLNSQSNPITQIGQRMGTNKYMAPEIENGIYSPQSDIYALGILMEELDLSEKYDEIIEKATQRKPKNRFQSVNEMIERINQIEGK
ncbi:protein kinase [Haemophilus sp. C1]|uniref:serine/threonine-protein kinase n=1 Tax=Haemophilus sp. C1 TaxID=1661745 RepID=UPI0006AB9E79|nr:serine/threonine-protein kinase [Haemophilus sp. C1]KOQ98400.1 protein kinase [Haemophilus sp. C1]